MTACAVVVASIYPAAYADEGMWQPSQLPSLAATLQERGLELVPKKLTELTDWPMDAVVSLGFCSASFVSPDGLVVTNHHCGIGPLQYNSTPQKNLVDDGFLARTKGEELPAAPTQRVYVTEAISDVTTSVKAKLTPQMDGYARYMAIDAAKKQLVQGCEQPGYRCDVYTFNGGDSYRLIKQREIRDVRLVYAPPYGIAQFGGEVDNWMWPRHGGDFLFLRAYVAKDGSSAPYSKDNVPYRPKHWLSVNPKGVEAGDFVMVAGYPGYTNRYRLAEELQEARDKEHPLFIELAQGFSNIVADVGKTKPEVPVKYADIVGTYDNYVKKDQGDLEAFARSNALEVKQAREAALDQWLAQQKPGGSVDAAALRADIGRLRTLVDARTRHRERDITLAMLKRGGLFNATYEIVRLADERQKPDAEREVGYQKRDEARLLANEKKLDRQMDPSVESRKLVYLLQRYVKLPATDHLPSLDKWLDGASDEAAITKKVSALFAGTRLTDTATRVKWLDATPAQIHASDDTWLQWMSALMPDLLTLERETKAFTGEEALLRPRYVQALAAYYAVRGLPIYPDANFTLRVTFGNVKGYEPRDGVINAPFTTAEGIVQKSGAKPFDIPAVELTAIRAKAYDGFASPKLGTLPVNFLSNLDITGGNSGSPTLDKNGRLVGLAFDGEWEGIDGDWLYDPRVFRTIHVDIRYMLWVMHHLGHADNLLEEMHVPVAN
ncbi:S46 family peptidase [Trinickia fusca]|uniref:Dipeptidyl-peptidase n=2 Tax=Trinickia fusca TaxID=2419777 RepID=A0A494X6Q9_9BURK|nr:S46 family peptidase [Trinickia fusca]